MSSALQSWRHELHKQLLRGKHVLLYGNVADLYPRDGDGPGPLYVNLRELLRLYFQESGYTVVGHYDIVDGLVLTDPERMRPEVERLRHPPQAGRPAPSPAATPTPTPAQSPTPTAPRTLGRKPGEMSRAVGPGSALPQGNLPPLPEEVDEALDLMRILLRQDTDPVAFCLFFADKLVADPQHPTREEAPLIVTLMKMMEEAAFLAPNRGGIAGNRRNPLVIVSETLGGVPAGVYQHNAHLALLQVPPPSRAERLQFLERNLENFRGHNDIPHDRRAAVADEFLDLTDGLTMYDLQALYRTSREPALREARATTGPRVELSIARPRRLIDYYKFGDPRDPWAELTRDKINEARTQLSQRVIGQDDAVGALVAMLISANVGIGFSEAGRAGKPKGVFFFVGPTGVGKTELAKGLAHVVFGDESALARFDMSEYAMEHAAEKLTGSPPGYVGYEEGGQLTRRVLERPFSLLLFDEIEKAHGKIMDKFLQILEDGRLTDSHGQTADFSQAVIIFTSNIGSSTLGQAFRPSVQPDYAAIREHYRREVRDHFTRPAGAGGLGRPELLNRLGDNIIVFDVLREMHVRAIAGKFLELLRRSVRERRGVELTYAGNEVVELVYNEMRRDPENLRMGGRRVKTLLDTLVLQPLSAFLHEHQTGAGATVTIGVVNNQVSIR